MILYKFRSFIKNIVGNLLLRLKKENITDLSNIDFFSIYGILNFQDYSKYLYTIWKKNITKLELKLLSNLNKFQKNNDICYWMISGKNKILLKKRLDYLEINYNKSYLKNILREIRVGKPSINNIKYLTNSNTVRHFYTLNKYLDDTNKNLNSIDKIIEFGGGFGTLSRIINSIKPKITYILIDLPLMCCLQFYYLASIFGLEKTNIIERKNQKIEVNKINILPICFIDDFNLDCQMFIATWSITETSKYCQNYILNKSWFKATNILLAYNSSKNSNFPNIIVNHIEHNNRFIIKKAYKTNNYAFI